MAVARRRNLSIRKRKKHLAKYYGQETKREVGRRLRKGGPFPYRHRRRNYRRRNQGAMLTGKAGAVIGILGGAAITKTITSFLPANLNIGVTGYLTTAIVAVLSGQVIGRTFNKRELGNWVTIGGLLIVGMDLLKQFVPGVQLPFGMSGMGLITDSNFYVPQVNLPGSMARFVTPAGIPAPVVVPAAAAAGMGATNQRRIGRMR